MLKAEKYRHQIIKAGIKVMPYVDGKRVKSALMKYRETYHRKKHLKDIIKLVTTEELEQFRFFLADRYADDLNISERDFGEMSDKVSWLSYEQTNALLNKVLIHKSNILFLKNNKKGGPQC